MQFSEYFRELDKKSITKITNKFAENKYYRSIMDKWQKPLERKQIQKQQKLENPVVPKEEDSVPSVFVHDPEEGV